MLDWIFRRFRRHPVASIAATPQYHSAVEMHECGWHYVLSEPPPTFEPVDYIGETIDATCFRRRFCDFHPQENVAGLWWREPITLH